MKTPKDPQEAFGRCLGQVARMWRAEIDERLAPHGLTEARWIALMHLSRLDGPVSQTTLARAAGVQGPTLVRTLDWLEKQGLIERREDAQNRRAKKVYLTEKAQPVIDSIRRVTRELRQTIFAGIDEAELRACLSVFTRMGQNLDPQNPTLIHWQETL